MPAVSLRCRVCATEHPLEATGTCTRCFGPLDPTYDWEALRATRQHGRSIEAGPASIWRYADLLPVEAPAEPRLAPGMTPLVPAPRLAEELGIGRALAQARHREPDPLVQGPRRRRGRAQGAGARLRHALVLLDGEPRRRRRGARGRRGPRGGRVRAQRPRAREARRGRRLRPPHLRRGRHVRPLLAPLGRAVLRAALGLRQRQPPVVLRRGVEDARVRDRGAARLGDPGRGRDPDRLGCALPQGRAGLRRARRRSASSTAAPRRSSAARRPAASRSRPPSARAPASFPCGPTASHGRSRSGTPPTATSPWRRHARRAERSTRSPRTRSAPTWPASLPRPGCSARRRRVSRSAP